MRQPDVDGTLDGQAAALVVAWSRCVRGGCNLRNGQDAKEQKAIACESVANCLGDTTELGPGLVALGFEVAEREIHDRIFHRVSKDGRENQHLFGGTRVD